VAEWQMADEKIGALVLTPGTSLVYFTNIRTVGTDAMRIRSLNAFGRS
jgi:hypothetical protein